VEKETIWTAISRGDFGDIKRQRDGGKGFNGVVARHRDYVNPLLTALEATSSVNGSEV
jgi:beta-lysine 5,6-aminomutase alpha subunit